MAKVLERTCILYRMPPDEVWNKPEGVRAFMFATAIRDIENGGNKCPFLRAINL